VGEWPYSNTPMTPAVSSDTVPSSITFSVSMSLSFSVNVNKHVPFAKAHSL
jgi:hypothetical protein